MTTEIAPPETDQPAPGQSYKDRIYENYYRTHILPRKGPVTLKQLDRAQKVFDLHFGRFLPPNKDAAVLDAGCGAGNLVHWLHARGYANARGVDSSIDQIEAGRALGLNNLEVGDLSDVLSSSPGRFDLVFMRDVLEHIEKPYILDVLETVLAALRPGGRLIMQMPNGASPVVGRVLYGDFTHESAYTVTSLSQVLTLAGYDDLEFFPYEPHVPPFHWRALASKAGWYHIVRRASWRLVRALYAFLIFAEIGPHRTIVTFNLISSARRPLAAGGKAS